ncbi:uncharacterized protein BX663DRAFT_525178 [Cokeromyces recurvatus]|uniref:uncharacterized protein n=1 Tax=Cokeromyces recurvatus TaxID=90255 RepID=UPI00221E566C|nr:uncharacterized protein BX663DRAFT_525178 [Cokeromyces recurvatus]KAI7898405.1 hypothetical protein BX663DRAFT_525178 [Cokeromyces recurvatus]
MTKIRSLNDKDEIDQKQQQQQQHSHNLFNWLNNVKHRHDAKLTETTETSTKSNPELPPRLPPPSSPQPMDINHNHLLTTPHDTTNDSASYLSDDKVSIRSKATSLFSRHFKDDVIHFHRPHGLLFGRKQPESSASLASLNPPQDPSYSCSCCTQRRNSRDTTSNDADDEGTSSTDEDNGSIRSKDWTKHPPCLCHNTAEITPTHELVSHNKVSRNNSVFSLPKDIDKPEVGFKKLKKDGDLVDWDELSSFLEEEEEEEEERHRGSIHVCQSSNKIHLRSMIRNDLIHLALNGPFKSPLSSDTRKHILHIGCSDGAWCMEVAKLFPNWLVVGIDDRSGGPLLPDQHKAPKNFKYIRCFYDILRTIKDFPSNAFDLVCVRFLLDAYGNCTYKDLIHEAGRICKPNGFVEIYELDLRIYGNPKAGPVTHKLNTKLYRAMETHNLNPRLARSLGLMIPTMFEHPSGHDAAMMERRKGSSDFEANYVSLPLGVWGGRLGVMFRDSIVDFFTDFQEHMDADSLASYDGSVSSVSDGIPYDKDIETMLLEMESQKAFMNLHYVYAKKS